MQTKRYEISIVEDSFKMKRIISYRNSFLPQIKGNLLSESDNSTVTTFTIQLVPFVSVFITIWISIALLGCSLILINISYDELDVYSIMPLSMPFFGYFMPYYFFNIEYARSKKDLINILGAEVVNE